ncbi:hypothetical protein MLD38_008201 [Melastoma candidum]|uniref:Uncharacterized protein n=1 Tax=Melastoma candidum TaxID=119954 RepID=A0ACB9RWM5_9MYRT|nr:hypothetical protein MLD38_008201 [Melastoma candidum]
MISDFLREFAESLSLGSSPRGQTSTLTDSRSGNSANGLCLKGSVAQYRARASGTKAKIIDRDIAEGGGTDESAHRGGGSYGGWESLEGGT